MAKKTTNGKTKKSVETLRHAEASRKHIPTAEYQSVLSEEQQTPIQVAYARRNPDLDPQLIWRGKAEGRAERLHLQPGATSQEARDRTDIRTAMPQANRLRALVSRSHLDERTTAWLAQRSGVTLTACGSSLKFCRLAEGSADVYPRLAPTMEWDVAAGDAVLTAAGGAVLTPDGAPLVYGQTGRGLRIPDFIAWGMPPAG